MKTIRILALALSFVTAVNSIAAAQEPPAKGEVLSFQAWKTGKVEDAKLNLEKLQADKMTSGASASLAAVDPKAKLSKSEQKSAAGLTGGMTSGPQQKQQKIQQAQANIEIAQELTVNDYFVLYLGQFKNNREAYVDAAKKLSPEDAADLMISYQKHLANQGEFDETTTVSQAK